MTFCSSNRPPNRSDASTTVTATEGSGGDPPLAGATGVSAQTSRSKPATDRGERSFGNHGSSGGGEPPSPSWCRNRAISPTEYRSQKRSTPPCRRLSSGYYSLDNESQPSSPDPLRPATADKSTQTPSPAGQVMNHALQCMAESLSGGSRTHQRHGERHFAYITDKLPASTNQVNAGIID